MRHLTYLLLASSVFAQGNLVKNGNFSRGLESWKIHFLEPNETKYGKNHESVRLVACPAGKAGKAVEFSSFGKVAASQGVKAVTELIEIDPSKSYEFGVDVLHSKTGCKVFLEGYKRDAMQTDKGSDQYVGYARCYRASIHVKAPNDKWTSESRVIELAKVPKRMRPTHVLVKLYCYYPPGKVYYTDVFLRETTKTAKKTYRPYHKTKSRQK